MIDLGCEINLVNCFSVHKVNRYMNIKGNQHTA